MKADMVKAEGAQPAMAAGPLRTMTVGLTVDGAPGIATVGDIIEARLAAHEALLVTFVNPASVAVSRAKPGFRPALETFDLVLPDGSAMSVAVRLLHRIPAARISFDSTSLAPVVLSIAERRGSRVALVGGVPGCTERAAGRLCAAFPQLQIAGCFDGYGDRASRQRSLAELDPDIVICGMGAGAQEDFLLGLTGLGWRGCGFTCGGYFDQLSQGYDYYPKWIDSFNLRWAWRLAKEPRRLWRRYLLDYPVFLARLLRQLVFTWMRGAPAGPHGTKIDPDLVRFGNSLALGTAQVKVDER